MKTMFPGTYAKPKYLEGATKVCQACGEVKPLFDFAMQNKHRKNPSRRAACRECSRAARRAKGSSVLGPKIGVRSW